MKRTAFDFPLPLSRGNGEPLRTQVIGGLRRAIQSGRLSAGTALPATRVLASDLGVSRGVIVEAYEQLLAEGYLEASGGSATRVAGDRLLPATDRSPPDGKPAASLAAAAKPIRYDFRPGVPDLSLFPSRPWMRAVRRAWAGPWSAVLDYPDPRGVEPVRIALTAYLNRSRATATTPDHIVMCTGFSQAARLVGEVLRARGIRRLAVEDPGHAEQCADFAAARIELVPVPVDAQGLDVARLPALDVKAVLVTPAHQYPTGTVLSAARRAALLAWAEERSGFIIEDDYDAEYRYDREPVGALHGLAPERVIYVGTASKMLAPSLRQGWLALPGELAGPVAHAKLSADRGSPALEQMALAHFLEAGELDRHLRRTRPIYRRRRDALVAALERHLPEATLHGVAAGLHLLVGLPGRVSEERVVQAAVARGIRVYGAGVFHARPNKARPALLLGYGGIEEGKIAAGVRLLAAAIQGEAIAGPVHTPGTR